MSMLQTPHVNLARIEKETLKTRSRSGCLTCRSRRLKCDEKAPCCENCTVNDRTCKWGLKASFHASRMHSLSKTESAFIRSLEAKQRRPVDLKSKFIDNTEEIASEYLAFGHRPESSPGSEGANESNESPAEPLNYAQLDNCSVTTKSNTTPLDFKLDERLPRDSGASLDQGTPAVSWDHSENMDSVASECSGEDGYFLQDQENLSADQYVDKGLVDVSKSAKSAQNGKLPPWPLSQYSKARLIASYLKETATWCETTDTDRYFSLKSAHTILSSQALSAAAVALASRQLDNIGGKPRVETLELYDFARRTLCSLKAWENDDVVLASVVQLCVYCMMSMEVVEWRLHLRGCAGTFQEMGWSGSSNGLPSACFWAFARIDIWAAYLTQQTTLIPTHYWIRHDYVEVNSSPLQDKYANKAIWIFARIINQLYVDANSGRSRPFPLSDSSTKELLDLWEELDTWYLNRPPCVQSVVEVEPKKAEAFPFILFGNQSAICGNIFYHTGCLLLLETDAQKLNVQRNSNIKFHPSWHARRIGGISITTDNHANWVNNLQPMFIAARYYDEPAEKIAALKHLKDIELATGWKTGSRSAELRELWGLG